MRISPFSFFVFFIFLFFSYVIPHTTIEYYIVKCKLTPSYRITAIMQVKH